MVIDADGLNFLATEPGIIADPPAPRILTPHPGEMGRLTGLSTKQIQTNRLETALKFTESVNKTSANVTTILKGAGTIIVDNLGSRYINTTGNPGMGTGGMGDVLSGVIGALICQGFPAKNAAVAGVYLHGAAADILYEHSGPGFYATEVADVIPEARNFLMARQTEFTR